MKKIFSFLSISVLIFLFSCESIVEPKKKLARSWITNEFIFKTNVKDFSLSKAELNVNLKFKDDGSYEYPEPGTDKTLIGTWQLTSEDTRLTLIDAQKKISSFEIVELTTSKMVLGWQKIDLTRTQTKADQLILNLYSDLLVLGNLDKAFSEAKPTSVQLYVGYVSK